MRTKEQVCQARPTATDRNTGACGLDDYCVQAAPEQTVSPKAKPIYVETGLASWYGPPYHNHKGANGEIYNQNALTAAHRTIPLNSTVRVTNETTKHTVIVRITDRGPFVEDRIIDLSLAAAKAVDVWQPGTAMVKVEVLSSPAPIDEGGRWCVQIGAFQSEHEARKLKEKLQDRYATAQMSSSSPAQPASGCASVLRATTNRKPRRSPARRT